MARLRCPPLSRDTRSPCVSSNTPEQSAEATGSWISDNGGPTGSPVYQALGQERNKPAEPKANYGTATSPERGRVSLFEIKVGQYRVNFLSSPISPEETVPGRPELQYRVMSYLALLSFILWMGCWALSSTDPEASQMKKV